METLEYGELIKDTKVLHLSTQTTSCIPLNGSMKSRVAYDVRGYLDFDSDDTIDYITVQMPYVVMSNSNYIVNQYNNKLIMTQSGIQSTYTLPQGNYTASTFLALLKATIYPPMTITYSTTTNKYTFKTDVSFSLNSGSTCDYIIGFSGTESSVYNVSTNYNELTCSRSYNFLPIPRYIIHGNIIVTGKQEIVS